MGYGNTEVYLTDAQREDLIQNYLGKTVEVTVDRPIGFVHHTKGITLRYDINYGYIPDLMGGDGEEQDVYILGVHEPISQFTGQIIAAVRRRDDNEDKLVAAPAGMRLSRDQIWQSVYFTEQYFDSTLQLYQEE